MSAWNPWDRPQPYCWVVMCRNYRFHNRQNTSVGHKIPLGETDAFSAPPKVDFRFSVRCDECGQERTYDASELLRFQMELPLDFKPHPLFALKET